MRWQGRRRRTSVDNCPAHWSVVTDLDKELQRSIYGSLRSGYGRASIYLQRSDHFERTRYAASMPPQRRKRHGVHRNHRHRYTSCDNRIQFQRSTVFSMNETAVLSNNGPLGPRRSVRSQIGTDSVWLHRYYLKTSLCMV